MARTQINVQQSDRNIVIKDNNNSTNVNVTQEITDIVDVATRGPQGSRGADGVQGPIGPKGNPGELTSFQDLTVTGSLFVSGTIEQGNITGSIITASEGFSGSLEGTSSYATTSSYAINATSASYSNNATSASYALSASFATNATSASNATTASFATNATSASNATTASFALNAGGAGDGFPFTGSAVISGSLNVIGPITASGNISSSGNINANSLILTDDLTAPNATAEFFNITASVISASGGINTLGAISFGDANQNSGDFSAFGDIIMLGTNARFKLHKTGRIDFNSGDSDLNIGANNTTNTILVTSPNTSFTGHITSSGNISASEGFTGSLEGTSSYATTSSYAVNTTSASYALSASYSNDATSASHAVTASFALNAGGAGDGFPFTGSADITGSLNVIGPITSSGNISASEGFTGSLEGTSSFATDAEIAEYTSEWILTADSSDHYIFTGPGFTGSASDPSIYLVRGQKYKFTNNMGAHPFRIQSTPNGVAGISYSNGVINNNVSNGTLLFNVPMDAPEVLYYQCVSHNNMGGPIYISHPISASYALSASHATTASFALNIPENTGFPFVGNAEITGSLGVTGPITASGIFQTSEKSFISGTRLEIGGAITSSGAISSSGGNIEGQAIVGRSFFVDGIRFADSVNTPFRVVLGNSSHPTEFHGPGVIFTQPITASIISASEGFTGSLEGTSSYATTASYAINTTSASYSNDATSASYALSASHTTTASFALNVPADTGFPFTGSAEITGSLNVVGPITSSIISSSGTITASAINVGGGLDINNNTVQNLEQIINNGTSDIILTLAEQNLQVTAKTINLSSGKVVLTRDGHITASLISASDSITGSLFGTSSFATSASHTITASFALNVPADTGFPFTGSAGITGSLDIVGPITSSGTISASRFKGDARDLFNIPQDLAWDGVLGDGILQIVTNDSYGGSPSNSRLISTSSIIYKGDNSFGYPVNNALIYKRNPSTAAHPTTLLNALLAGAIIFSGSVGAVIDATTNVFISAGTVKVINLDNLNIDSEGKILDINLLGAINDLLKDNTNNSSWNDANLNYNIQDSYRLNSLSEAPQQIGVSYLKTADPGQTAIFDYHFFISHSEAQGETNGVFQTSENPNKVYTSLNTDLETTFNSNVSSSGIVFADSINADSSITSSAVSSSGIVFADSINADSSITSSAVLISTQQENSTDYPQSVSGIIKIDQNISTANLLQNSSVTRDITIGNRTNSLNSFSGVTFIVSQSIGRIAYQRTGNNGDGDFVFLAQNNLSARPELLRISGLNQHISASVPITASGLFLDFDSMPTTDPGVKGAVYRSASLGNQLFISAG